MSKLICKICKNCGAPILPGGTGGWYHRPGPGKWCLLPEPTAEPAALAKDEQRVKDSLKEGFSRTRAIRTEENGGVCPDCNRETAYCICAQREKGLVKSPATQPAPAVPHETVVEVPSIGEPIWQGEITDGQLLRVQSGLTIPNQGFSKAMAREIATLREKLAEAERKGCSVCPHCIMAKARMEKP